MRIDTYIKVVLTIIAVCLVWMSLGGPALITSAEALPSGQHVIIAGWLDTANGGHSLPLPVVMQPATNR